MKKLLPGAIGIMRLSTEVIFGEKTLKIISNKMIAKM
jgi:hypothetical protein